MGRMLTGPRGCTSSGPMSMNEDGHARLPHLGTAGAHARPNPVSGMAATGGIGPGGRVGCVCLLAPPPPASPGAADHPCSSPELDDLRLEGPAHHDPARG